MEPATLVAIFGVTSLAVVVAFFSLWSRKGRTEDEARAYLAGFTYVLSDDPDAAIAELSRAAELNRQTLETYFALGALFRRQGELERAIRLHQNILLRAGLNADVRRRAQLALAMDYKRSRMPGKAAEAFEKLLADDPDHREGLLHYRRVLESTGDWAKAIELQTRLVKLEGTGQDLLAHLLAELARAQMGDGSAEVEELAERGAQLGPSSADALLALGEVRLAKGKRAEAAGPIRSALLAEPELAPRSVRLLSAALDDPQEVEAFLEEQMSAQGERGAPFALALALHRAEAGRVAQAIAGLRKLIERRPHFWEARKELGVLLLAQDRSEELRADYQQMLATLGLPALGFMCAACRQKLPSHLFRCPACESWDTVRREEQAS